MDLEKQITELVMNAVQETTKKIVGEKLEQDIFPTIKKRITEEFGYLPQIHAVRVNNAKAVKIKETLPPCFDSILKYAANGTPVMMTGEAGTGKGFIARNVAKALEAGFYEVNAVKNSYDLTGFVDAHSRYNQTPFYNACKDASEGKKAVFLFDEMDCSEPEVLKIFNEAISSLEFSFPNNEKLEFPNLIILCACNTFGTGNDEQYVGERLDASTLDRFVMVKVDYNRKVEVALAQGDEALVDFIDAFRNQVEKNGLLFVVSYRSLKRITSMKGVLPLKQVIKECLIKSMSDDDLESVLINIKGMEKNIYYRAAKGENVSVPTSKAGKAYQEELIA